MSIVLRVIGSRLPVTLSFAFIPMQDGYFDFVLLNCLSVHNCFHSVQVIKYIHSNRQ